MLSHFSLFCFLPFMKASFQWGENKKSLQTFSLEGFYFVGVRGFEPPTSTPPAWRANRATLHPEIKWDDKDNFVIRLKQ